jgi:hypothetical protein
VERTIIMAKDPTPKPSIAMPVIILIALIFFLEKRYRYAINRESLTVLNYKLSRIELIRSA